MRARTVGIFALLCACASEGRPTPLDASIDLVTHDAPGELQAIDSPASADAAVDAPPVVDTPSSADAVEARDLPDAQGPSTLRVLFIGNSYTYYNDLPAMVASLGATGAGTPSRPRIEAEQRTEGGASLQRHWDQMRQAQLRVGTWNALVLQGQSVEPIAAFQGFESYARRFADAARDVGARTVYFATWARRAGDAVYSQSWSGGDFRAMSARLDDAYRLVAMRTAGEVAPVGAAWASALSQRASFGLYDADGSHPSRLGSYLAACVIYRALTGQPVTSDAPVPDGVSAEDARLAREVAAAQR